MQVIMYNSSDANFSGDGSGDLQDCPYDTDLYTQITGTILFVIVWPFIVLDMKFFPLGRPAAALVGATLMVLFQVVTQSDVYVIEGDKGSLQTVFLLVGMMMLSYYYDREGILKMVMLKIFGQNKPFYTLLWKVCFMSAVLSAFITNDATCLVITPLLLTEFIKQGRDKSELLPLCLGIATSANIGGAATIFGNPQNAFIASKTGINLLQFFIAELPAALIGLAINIALIHLFIVRKVCKDRGIDPCNERGLQCKTKHPKLCCQQTTPVDSYEVTTNNHVNIINVNGNGIHRASSLPNELNVVNTSFAVELNEIIGEVQKPTNNNEAKKESICSTCTFIVVRQKLFIAWLIFITVLMIVLLAIPPSVAEFNLGCIPLGASTLTMLMDTILNRKYAYDVMLKIDWTVILMFMGLFIWLQGFQNTCFPYLIFEKLAPYMNLTTIEGVLLFSVFIIIGSNVFSNVPLVILIVDRITGLCGDEPCNGPLGGLLLAWIATIAGNFTLIGSVANLIVAEKAQSSANYRITFFGYLKFGFFSTLVIIYACLPIVYFLGLVANNV